MPPRKSKNTKKKSSRRAFTALSSTPSGLPKTRRATLRYCESITLDSTSGTLGTYNFSCNNIFDPNITSTGHQPMGHDTWSSMYNHYVVLGSKATVHWSSPGTSSTTNCMVGVILTDDASVPYSTYEGVVEAKKGTYKSLVIQRGDQRTVTKFSAKDFFNVTDLNDNITRLGSGFGGSPTDQAYYTLWAQTANKSSTAEIRATVVIDYIVEFSEPKDMSQS